MVFSRLYSALINKKWFYDFRHIDERVLLINKFLQHDIPEEWNAKNYSETHPIEYRASSQKESSSDEVNSYDDAPNNSIAVLPLKGDMIKDGTWCSYGTGEIAAMMREAADSEKILGIVLDVDSGGGAVDAIAPIVDAIQYVHSKKKCVVASIDLCASAAYYASIYCDEIIANNMISAEVGSIGVMCSIVDYEKYYESEGIKVHSIYSDLSKYKNEPYEAAKKGEYGKIKSEQLDPLAKNFQDAVKKQRCNLDTKIEGILEGRVFFAQDAKANGLIDDIGNMDFAIARCRRKCEEMTINDYINS